MASNAPNPRPRYNVYMPDSPDRVCDSFRMEEAEACVGDLEDAIRNSPRYKNLRREDFYLYKVYSFHLPYAFLYTYLLV